ncbi:hypothetical protein [Laribacter hongkongensis]|uniref:hypothetical protein n=1 Tax=Laribacter hongkongensis TaxID=168471 RepID=UPI001EFDF320|nr:hypothetical protein [Laribacter hongkongensis]MCG9094446.1 hypothetical protein [Laribacter hongkongensis]
MSDMPCAACAAEAGSGGRVRLSEVEAEKIEAAWRALPFDRVKVLLKLHFCDGVRVEVAARKSGIQPACAWLEVMRGAKWMHESMARVDVGISVRQNSHNKRIPALAA